MRPKDPKNTVEISCKNAQPHHQPPRPAGRAELESLLKRVLAARSAIDWGGLPPPPLLLKIAPDLTPDDMKVGRCIRIRA